MNPEPHGSPRFLEALVQQRYSAALAQVQRVRTEHPDEQPEDLVARIIRRCSRDLAMGGAMTGGAAASPVAGAATAVGALGAETAFGVGRLGEMVMAIGILNGLEHSSASERAVWVAAALGISEGAAMGLTGIAARTGARGGARLLQRLPNAASTVGTGRTGRMAARMAAKGGPWSLAALVPFGIGAGLGAAGNAALAVSVGRAARVYFASQSPPPHGSATSAEEAHREEIWDVEVIEERILEDDS